MKKTLSVLLLLTLLIALLPGGMPIRVLASEASTEPPFPAGIIEPEVPAEAGEGIASGTPAEAAEDAHETESIDETTVPPTGPAGIAEGVPSDSDIPMETDGSQESITVTESTNVIDSTEETTGPVTDTRPRAPRLTLTRDFLLGVVAVLLVVIGVLAVLLLQTRKTCSQLQAQIQKLQESVPPRTEQQPTARKPSVVTAPRFTVCGVSGVHAGRRYPIRQQLGLGRDASCEIRYPAELNNISSVHCALIPNKEGVVLVDLGSTGGTFLPGGKRLKPHHNYLLKRGDSFCLCNPEQTFRIE